MSWEALGKAWDSRKLPDVWQILVEGVGRAHILCLGSFLPFPALYILVGCDDCCPLLMSLS